MKKTCSFCGALADLCRSHVIPEFIYRPLYDDKHRFSILNKDTERVKYAQRGLTERLLCKSCEQQFGRYEQYAANVMTGKIGHCYHQRGNRIVISGIDYKIFKLFQLSVLWRSSVSSLEFFKLVSLGPHEKRVQIMLQNEDPGEPQAYGCAVVFASERCENISDTIFNPEPFRWSGHLMVKLFFAGSAWLFHCDSRVPSTFLQSLFLQRDGSMVGLAGDIAEAHFYGKKMKKIARRAGF